MTWHDIKHVFVSLDDLDNYSYVRHELMIKRISTGTKSLIMHYGQIKNIIQSMLCHIYETVLKSVETNLRMKMIKKMNKMACAFVPCGENFCFMIT